MLRDEITKLVALRDSGAITDEEFTAYKDNLLPEGQQRRNRLNRERFRLGRRDEWRR